MSIKEKGRASSRKVSGCAGKNESIIEFHEFDHDGQPSAAVWITVRQKDFHYLYLVGRIQSIKCL